MDIFSSGNLGTVLTNIPQVKSGALENVNIAEFETKLWGTRRT